MANQGNPLGSAGAGLGGRTANGPLTTRLRPGVSGRQLDLDHTIDHAHAEGA